ncbi:hypothetical protein FHS57_003731 [Runella defluvii]|uniref:Fibronectin type-III domain-containing protein n=1 Tax=Runella defluvii TaxID=370973 RepID=A0A7W5ZLR1_9BACT|nr:hypothetical protein [Runella defluvii]MBB3839722.1 hypothetical protein [Runella defluvii]
MNNSFLRRILFIALAAILGVVEVSNGQSKPAPAAKPKKYNMSNEKMEAKPSVGIVVKAIQSRICLRWIPVMQSYWEFGHRDGYIVERINVKTKQRVVISNRVMPKRSADWQSFLDKKDRNYSLLYAALYEEPEFSNDPITQINERRQLFHFALFCADMDFQAACMAGLGLIDSTAVSGERYQYVVSHKSAARYKLLSGISMEVGLGDVNVLPDISNFSGKVGGKVVTLLTPTASLRQSYNQYQIERSDDSIHYQSITELPIIVTNKLDTLAIADTLVSEDTFYYYRIRGITVFQEKGPYSSPLRVKAKTTLPSPEIYAVKETTDKAMLEVQWLYKDSLNQYIDHYQIVGSLEPNGSFVSLKDSIPADQHLAFIKAMVPTSGFTFFIKLRTFTKKGAVLETLSMPVVLADDDAPAQPQGLKGSIKVEGEQAIVTVSWMANPDADLFGYYLNRRDRESGQFYRVNNSFITQTTLTDTIYLRQMQKYVHYTVKAIDMLFKESIDSKVLILKVPDINPPTSPIIDSFAVEDKKIFLRWTRSYSDDVQKHILYRKKLPTTAWEEVMTLTDTLRNTYIDSNVVEKSLYAYTLIAFDDTQNQSEPASPVVLETPYFTQNVDFVRFSSVLDTVDYRVKLSWECKQTDKIDNFLIYRASQGKELAFVKKMDKNNREWRDLIEVEPNTVYKYVIRAKMQEGYLSGWKETEIELKP